MKLLTGYPDCEALLNADNYEPKIATRLEGNEAALYLYRGLFQVRRDCPIHGNLKAWRVRESTDQI